jgi:hypothetical protein
MYKSFLLIVRTDHELAEWSMVLGTGFWFDTLTMIVKGVRPELDEGLSTNGAQLEGHATYFLTNFHDEFVIRER